MNPFRMTLRKARPSDARFLFELRNDPDVVSASASGAGVDWPFHQAWFAYKLRQGARLYIVELEGEPSGYIRFDETGNPAEYEVAVGLLARARNLGVGRRLIELASQLNEALGARSLIARIRPQNAASIKAFEAAGFVSDSRNPISQSSAGVELLRFIRTSPAPTSGQSSLIPAPESTDSRQALSGLSATITAERDGQIQPSPPVPEIRAALVADAFEGAGLGHLARAYSLACALQDEGAAWAIFAVAEHGDDLAKAASLIGRRVLDTSALEATLGTFHVVVLDSYFLQDRPELGRTRELLAAIEEQSHREGLVVGWICDGTPPPIEVDLAVDPAPRSPSGRYTHRARTVMAGERGLLLSPSFRGLRHARTKPLRFPPSRIFVDFGSAAPPELYDKVLEGISRRISGAEFVVPRLGLTASEPISKNELSKKELSQLGLRSRISSQPPYLRPEEYAEALFSADFAILAGGVSSLEAAAAGKPQVVIALEENQKGNAVGLAESGAALLAQPSPEAIVEAAVEIATNRSRFAAMVSKAQEAVDPYGAIRVGRWLCDAVRRRAITVGGTPDPDRDKA
jgi:spore coat polysaccharide biosynthesis predicted glycosyltransferase SpsG/L-amino acid N-acyltransferase YncA